MHVALFISAVVAAVCKGHVAAEAFDYVLRRGTSQGCVQASSDGKNALFERKWCEPFPQDYHSQPRLAADTLIAREGCTFDCHHHPITIA